MTYSDDPMGRGGPEPDEAGLAKDRCFTNELACRGVVVERIRLEPSKLAMPYNLLRSIS